MNGNYVQEGKYSFLRIEAVNEADERFEVRMITNNQPEMLLKMVVTREGGQSFFDYNITGLSSLSSAAEEAATYLFSVISGLERLGEVLPEYLLSSDAVSLAPEHIFVRKETGQVFFCYLPGREGSFQESVRAMMEFFMKYAAPSDPEEVLLLYGLYQRSREEDVRPESLAELWRDKKSSSQKKEELPVIEEQIVAFPDEDIYAELGMEQPKKPQRLFGNPLSGGYGRSESEREDAGIWQKREKNDRESGRAAPGSDEKNRKKLLGFFRKKQKEGGRDEELMAAGSLQEKWKILWKNHKGEIAVGAVVVVGAVLILIR